MAVSFSGSAESHTGTTGSTSEAFFEWTITPIGTARGILVFTFVNANADNALSVKINPATDNLDVPVVTGGRAVDTAGETGDCKAWFLGSGVPSGTLTIRVNRTNNTNVMYGVAASFAANEDTAVHEAGIVLLQNDGTLAEQSVTDGSPGTDSVRMAGVNSGLAAPPAAGASSTLIQSIDFGARGTATVRETTAGQGARNVGFSSGTSDDRAAVHLAVKELPAAAANPVIDTVVAMAA